jgi:hypothetical protein
VLSDLQAEREAGAAELDDADKENDAVEFEAWKVCVYVCVCVCVCVSC